MAKFRLEMILDHRRRIIVIHPQNTEIIKQSKKLKNKIKNNININTPFPIRRRVNNNNGKTPLKWEFPWFNCKRCVLQCDPTSWREQRQLYNTKEEIPDVLKKDENNNIQIIQGMDPRTRAARPVFSVKLTKSGSKAMSKVLKKVCDSLRSLTLNLIQRPDFEEKYPKFDKLIHLSIHNLFWNDLKWENVIQNKINPFTLEILEIVNVSHLPLLTPNHPAPFMINDETRDKSIAVCLCLCLIVFVYTVRLLFEGVKKKKLEICSFLPCFDF